VPAVRGMWSEILAQPQSADSVQRATALTITRLIPLTLDPRLLREHGMSARFDVLNRLPGVTARHEPTTGRI